MSDTYPTRGGVNFWDDLVNQRQEARLGVDSTNMRRKLLAKQDGCCFWCLEPMEPGDRTLDHLIPHSLGGPYVLANLALAHRSCNERRGSRFDYRLLERLPDSVLALTVENLQLLPADAYEAVSESQARVLKQRLGMEVKVWDLLVQRLHARHAQFSAEMEPSWKHRRRQERLAWQGRGETAFKRTLAALRKSEIAKCIRQYEKENKLVPLSVKPRKEAVIRRRKLA